ncbi:class A beta-lactamase-related serine hydrolase [Aneurinibacillus thermoaerophilus]|uniref:serine hydrolase n=1 Tax=Aneurinibacillus thermoaerophilus TaxID=143495 RepID=UPI002E21F575|nr:class A beta-lactamase-related serine hydrolase [Aneurinibacillus thermoaerophilus]MED0761329.1 class A beta-lactamase-related serine hydrolase [Aneurinibacillus thermoaerophilus]
MDWQKLRRDVERIVSQVDGKVSVAIETDEGHILINANDPLPSASLIKIPIMIAAYRQAQEGKLNLFSEYSFLPEDRVGGMGVLSHLSPELRLTLKDLISLMIMISDNTATNMVIRNVGMDTVNQLAADLNCGQTVLVRMMMDHEAVKRGKDNMTSASDIVRFLKEIVEGSILNEENKKAVYDTLLNQQFHTKLPALITGGFSLHATLAHKTGELPGTEHDAGIFCFNGKYAYVAVLTTELSDNASGQRMIAQVGKLVFDYLRA